MSYTKAKIDPFPEKQIKYRKGWVSLQRIFFWILKLAVYFLVTAIMAIFLFYLITSIIYCIETGTFINIGVWKRALAHYIGTLSHNSIGDTYIPTIVVAVASMLVALITLCISHYNRSQDRIFGFPDNILEEVKIGLDKRYNVKDVCNYFDLYLADTVLHFRYSKTFAAYYHALPYRLIVCLDRGDRVAGKRFDWEEIAIYNDHNLNRSVSGEKSNVQELIIEGGKSKLLTVYCNAPESNKKFKLDLVLDLRWTNRLLPGYSRRMADLYMRNVIRLDACTNTQDKIYTYSVLRSCYCNAGFTSWILKLRNRKGNLY